MIDLVYAYTRQQAIEDGVLVDVSEMAKEAGFRYPVAVTAAVWSSCIAVPDACPWQDERGRLWDVITMLQFAIRKSDGGSLVHFSVLIQNDEQGPRPVQLKSLCHPGDDLRPVVTILLPGED